MPAEMTPDDAATVALRMLAHMAGDDDSLDRFMALTGMALDDLKAQADQPTVWLAVLEFYLNHEPSLLTMAEETGMAPELPGQAHRALFRMLGAEAR